MVPPGAWKASDCVHVSVAHHERSIHRQQSPRHSLVSAYMPAPCWREPHIYMYMACSLSVHVVLTSEPTQRGADALIRMYI